LTLSLPMLAANIKTKAPPTPPRAVSMRALDVDGREVHIAVRGDARC